MTKVHIPTDPAQLEDMLGDTSQLKAIFGDADSTKEFVTNYARVVHNKDAALGKQLQESVQAGMADFLRTNGYAQNKLDLANNGPRADVKKVSKGRGAVYNQAAPGAREGLDKHFDSTAEYFQTIWHHSQTLKNSEELAPKLNELRRIQNSFGSEVPADGGFLIPETLRSDILMWSLEHSIVRPLAQVIPMSSLRVPIPMIDSTSNVSSVFGGIVAYWTEEGAALTESQASFGRVVLDAKKLTAYAEIPNELLADAVAFGSFFDQIFPQAVAFYEDYAFMQGTGDGEPLGFVNGPAVASVAKESGQTTGTIVWENIVKMYARMLPTSLGKACWLAAIDTFPQLATMALSVGTGGGPVWIGGPSTDSRSGASTPPVTILGRPVYFTEKLPTLGTTGDICFVDLSYYLIGDRQVMQAQSSPHYKFANDKTAFRVIERVDGRPWLQSAITPKNNSSSTLSAFVQVATR
jgi:HK97 family phage major capsid protein